MRNYSSPVTLDTIVMHTHVFPCFAHTHIHAYTHIYTHTENLYTHAHAHYTFK